MARLWASHTGQIGLRRDAELRAAGFEVVRFTWEEITHVPARVAAAIRAAFGRGARSR